MKQRLQIARILLHDPKVLVLDEPASDLDPRARIEIRDLLLELRSSARPSSCRATSSPSSATCAPRSASSSAGGLLVAGPIGEIAERLAAERSASATGEPVPAAAVQFAPSGGVVPPPVSAAPFAAPGSPSVVAPAALTTAGGVDIPPAARKRLRLRVLGDSNAVLPLIVGGSGVLGIEPGRAGSHRVTTWATSASWRSSSGTWSPTESV